MGATVNDVQIDDQGVMQIFMSDGRLLTAAGNAKGPKGDKGDTVTKVLQVQMVQGADGAPGVDGIGSLMITSQAAGDNCAVGGIRIDHGLDANGSGTLDNDELRVPNLCVMAAAPTPMARQVFQQQPSPRNVRRRLKDKFSTTPTPTACACDGQFWRSLSGVCGNGIVEPGVKV